MKREITVKDFINNHVPGVVDIDVRNISYNDAYLSEIYAGKAKDIDVSAAGACKELSLVYVYPGENGGLIIGGNAV